MKPVSLMMVKNLLSIFIKKFSDCFRFGISFRKIFFDVLWQVLVVDNLRRPEQGSAFDPDDVTVLEVVAHFKARQSKLGQVIIDLGFTTVANYLYFINFLQNVSGLIKNFQMDGNGLVVEEQLRLVLKKI